MSETAEIQQPTDNGLKNKPDSRPILSPGQRARQRFRRNRLAMISTWYLIVLVAVVIAWPIGTENCGRNWTTRRSLCTSARSRPVVQYAICAARRTALVWH